MHFITIKLHIIAETGSTVE